MPRCELARGRAWCRRLDPLDDHGILDRVFDVRSVDAVLERRCVDVHWDQSYYETRPTVIGTAVGLVLSSGVRRSAGALVELPRDQFD
jgi:hypothetical protein